MASLIIASTNKGVGKTTLVSGIAQNLAKKLDVLPEILDSQKELNPLFEHLKTDKTKQKITIIEGKEDHKQNFALAEKLDAVVLLVAQTGDNLAAINDYKGRFGGLIFNKTAPYYTYEAQKQSTSFSGNYLGSVPEDRLLLANELGSITDVLDGSYVYGEDKKDALIENILIGGMVLDWGPFYFRSRERVLLIVRGDRPDIQLAALQSDTVKGVVLTGGTNPIEYVYYEAKHQKIPLIKVNQSTTETIDALEKAKLSPNVLHEDKFLRSKELVENCLDLEQISDLIKKVATT